MTNALEPDRMLLLECFDSSDFQLIRITCLVPRIDESELRKHSLLKQLNLNKPVIFDGNAPTWLYGHLACLAARAPWVACSDPKLQGAVVVSRQADSAPMIGAVIPREKFAHLLPPLEPSTVGAETKIQRANVRSNRHVLTRTIAIVGPPHSGKTILLSILNEGLRRQIAPIDFIHNVYFIRSAPDGEGNWFQEMPLDQALVLRRKHQFTEDFAVHAGQSIRNLNTSKKLVLVDCGGKIDRLQGYIWSECSHAIIISASSAAIPEWRGAVTAYDVKLIAELESVLEPTCEVLCEDPLRLRIGRLERGEKSNWPKLPQVLYNSILDGVGLKN